MPALSISIVIPTYNSGGTLSRCLESVRTQTSPCDDVIIVDKFSNDKTIQIAKQHGASVVQTNENRSVARNTGLHHTSSSVVLFLDSDMIAPPTLIEECRAEMENFQALVIPEASLGTGFWAECKSLERKMNRDNYMLEAARCFSRDALLKLGGFNRNLEAGEDWDLQQRAIKQGFSIGRLRSEIVHDEGNLTLARVFGKKFLYGKTFGTYLRDNPKVGFKQVNPISRIVNPSLEILPLDPPHATGLAVLKSIEYFGAGMGFLFGRFSHQDREYIGNLPAPLITPPHDSNTANQKLESAVIDCFVDSVY